MNGSQAPVGLAAYPSFNAPTPAGVHVANQIQLDPYPGRPLGFHPELASAAPHYHSLEASSVKSSQDITSNCSSSSNTAHEILAHRRQASVEDVLEAVEALSKLKGKGQGSMIPRIR
jgi:hypothetical protein